MRLDSNMGSDLDDTNFLRIWCLRWLGHQYHLWKGSPIEVKTRKITALVKNKVSHS